MATLMTAAACGCGSPPPSVPTPDAGAVRALDSARTVIATLRDTLAARGAGYHRIAPPQLTDLNPYAGEHWINERFNRSRTLDLARPAYLMYYPYLGEDSLTLVGVGYTIAQPAGSPAPDGFPGAHDHWHVHLPCGSVPGLRAVLAESLANCEELGGSPGTWQVAMVHVWREDFPSPDGPFAQFNPSLPYMVLGIAPPTRDELHDPASGRLLRALGLALGETFGAVPRLGARIAQNPDSVFADSVRPYREVIRALIPQLRTARGDVAQFQHLARAAVAQWQHIRYAYLDAVVSPEHRIVLDRWFEAALIGHHRTQYTP